MVDAEGLMTIREAAALVHVHVSTLRRWEKSGLLRPYRVGRRGDRRYTRVQLLELLTGEQLNGTDANRVAEAP